MDVCAIGVQTMMQSDHCTPRNQNELQILRMIFVPSVRDSSPIGVEILIERKRRTYAESIPMFLPLRFHQSDSSQDCL